MTPQAMPDAPAPTPRLSRTSMSPPPPRPRRRSSAASCHAVESPWMPAPTITYLLGLGIIAPPFPAAETSRYYCPEGNSISITTRNHIVARTGQPATRQVAAVQRAIAILTELADAGTELGTNEIARRTGINVSTISRILATLVSGGPVAHVTATRRYPPGVGGLPPAGAPGPPLAAA